MEAIIRKATAITPYVNFNAQSGRMVIQGRLIPQQTEDFWSPILKWFYAYSYAPHKKTELIINLEYFNSLSSKQIMFLLHRVNELHEKGFKASVTWQYDADDEDMKEAGTDFSCMVNVPFYLEEMSIKPQ